MYTGLPVSKTNARWGSGRSLLGQFKMTVLGYENIRAAALPVQTTISLTPNDVQGVAWDLTIETPTNIIE